MLHEEEGYKVEGFTKSFDFAQKRYLESYKTFKNTFNAPPNDPKRLGICYGLSLLWVAQLIEFHHETPQKRFETLASRAGLCACGQIQDVHTGPGGDWQKRIFSKYSLNHGSLWQRPLILSLRGAKSCAEHLARKATVAQKYCLWILGYCHPNSGKHHSAASYCSGGKMGISRHFYFFDSNFGEYKVAIRDVSKFLQGYIDSYSKENWPIDTIGFNEVRRGAYSPIPSGGSPTFTPYSEK